MIKRAHLEIFGRVQGVYFRQETMEQAISHGVNGWVRNNREGNVEAIFEGDEQAVKEMVEWCGRGPVSARVERMEVSWEIPTGEFDWFQISRSGW